MSLITARQHTVRGAGPASALNGHQHALKKNTEQTHRTPAAIEGYGWLLLVCSMILLELGVCWIGLSTSLVGRVDFKAFYCAGRLLLVGRGAEIYSRAAQHTMQAGVLGLQGQTLPFLYPAFAALLFVPLAMLSYRCAFFVWMTSNVAVFAVAVRLLVREDSGPAPQPRIVQYLMFAVPLPIVMALMQGQITFLLLLVFLAVHCFFRRGAHLLAGLVLALALVKFQLAVPVALLFLGWKCFRLFAGFLLGGAGVALLSLCVSGGVGMLTYGRGLMHMGSATWIAPKAAQVRYGMFAGDMPNLHGLCFMLLDGGPVSLWLAIAASLAVMIWALRRPPSMAVALPAAMLVSYHMQAYDLVLLLLPLTLAGGRAREAAGEGLAAPRRLPRGKLLAAALSLLSPPVAGWLLLEGLLPLLAVPVLLVLVAAASLPVSEASESAFRRGQRAVTGRRGLEHDACVAHESDFRATPYEALVER